MLKIENFELYLIVLLSLFTILFIFHTIRYYRGEKRKIKHLHRFAKEGEIISQYNLAQRYHKGNMIRKSCQNAAFWYRCASFSGHTDAKNHLDNMVKRRKC